MRSRLRPPTLPPIENPTPFESVKDRAPMPDFNADDHSTIPQEFRSEEPSITGSEPATRWSTDTGESLIDRESTVEGKVHSKKNLRVEGRVEGEVNCEGTLVVADGAVVQARVEAENVTVSGTIEGEVICRGHLHVLASGRIEGSATALKIAIDSGATYEGELHMMEPPARAETDEATRYGPAVGVSGRPDADTADA